MSSPFVGEIRMFGGNFAPVGWAFCDGALVPISENDTLFNLIGTTYGGDGQSTFALPDLRDRVPVHTGLGGYDRAAFDDPSHLSTVGRDTPSSREIRAFFHFDRSAKVRKRIKISAISRSLRSFWAASISLGIKGVF